MYLARFSDQNGIPKTSTTKKQPHHQKQLSLTPAQNHSTHSQKRAPQACRPPYILNSYQTSIIDQPSIRCQSTLTDKSVNAKLINVSMTVSRLSGSYVNHSINDSRDRKHIDRHDRRQLTNHIDKRRSMIK